MALPPYHVVHRSWYYLLKKWTSGRDVKKEGPLTLRLRRSTEDDLKSGDSGKYRPLFNNLHKKNAGTIKDLTVPAFLNNVVPGKTYLPNRVRACLATSSTVSPSFS